MPTWLLVSIASAVGLGAYYVATAAPPWPPSQGVQQGLQAQIQQQYTTSTGQPVTPALSQQLATALAQAPAQYQATLPAGTLPTVAGYQAWVMARVNAIVGLGSGAHAPGQSANPAWPYQPQSAVAGPLGLQGPNPFPRWDCFNNAWFTDFKGQPWTVWNSNFAAADYRLPVSIRGVRGELHLTRRR